MTATRDPMPGQCFLCRASIPKAQAARHVKACLKAKPQEPGEKVKALHLRVEGRYNPGYWMHIEIPGARTLYDLDGFLRQTWLECCSHLSCFMIGGQRYAYEPYNDSFSDRREKSMDAKLYKAVQSGAVFTHLLSLFSCISLRRNSSRLFWISTVAIQYDSCRLTDIM